MVSRQAKRGRERTGFYQVDDVATLSLPIDIGSAAIDRANSNVAGFTFIALDNPANETGLITSVELWFLNNATGVKVGTFSRSGDDFTYRDHATIGAVVSGSKQTFSGLGIDVVAGDYIGIYFATGNVEYTNSPGGVGVYNKAGDQMSAGTQTYTNDTLTDMSVFGDGGT